MSERAALVVEDSPTMRQLIALALRRLPGLAIYEVSNGAEALEALGAEVAHTHQAASSPGSRWSGPAGTGSA